MNNKQISIVLFQLHQERNVNLEEKLSYFNLTVSEKKNFKKEIEERYNRGIKVLNNSQLNNIIDKINTSGYDEPSIKSRLDFYEVDKKYQEEILFFFKNFSSSNLIIDVSEIDDNFKGVQVASRDDFNKIINEGYTGDWVLCPDNIKHNYVQVASMNESGQFPRGFYLNAEIDRVEPKEYGSQIRYRIYIKNPIVIDSGNRNIKFTTNPVKYID